MFKVVSCKFFILIFTDGELFLKVEDFCANPEKYPVLNAWSYEYTENQIDK